MRVSTKATEEGAAIAPCPTIIRTPLRRAWEWLTRSTRRPCFAPAPRLGVAYQINPKTVLRAGAGLTYGVMQSPAGMSYIVADYYSLNPQGYGITPMPNGLAGGNPLPNLTFPDFSPGKYPVPSGGYLPPGNPNLYFAPKARPPRIFQWSIGLQRELHRDIVVEATYVGNRLVWGAAPYLDEISSNSLNQAILSTMGSIFPILPTAPCSQA